MKNLNLVKFLGLSLIVIACSIGAVKIYNDLEDQKDRLEKDLIDMVNENAALKQAEQIAMDSALYYKTLADGTLVTIDSLQLEMSVIKDELNNIPDIIADVTPSEAYDSLQTILEPRSDSLNYTFSGNQTKEIYQDELELLVMKEAFVICENTVDEQMELIGLQKYQVSYTKAALDTCQLRATNAESIANSAVQETEETKQELKKWKIGTIGGGSAALLLLLLVL